MKDYNIDEDFLSYLRNFTNENINDDDFFRDCFFDSLMVVREKKPPFFDVLTDERAEKADREINIGITGNYILATKMAKTIEHELSINRLISDNGCELVIDGENAHAALDYATAIKILKNLIIENSTLFDVFKQALLQGLIKRNCKSHIDYKRLNQLVGIYAEHKYNIELPEELPELIDLEFLFKLPELKYSENDNAYINLVNEYLLYKLSNGELLNRSYLPR